MTHNPNPASRSLGGFLRSNFSTLFSIAALLLVGVLTIALQNKLVAWEPGYDPLQPGHHGWVSSQGLAIISTATAQNHFVGYAVQYKDEQGNLVDDYFDRYPVFFSAIFNRILTLEPNLSGEMYLAKQVMNLIFLATLLLAFLILDRLIQNKPLALAATLITFANPFLLFYKDMVHFDQPALFGVLLLIYAISLYKLDGLKVPVFIATFVAIGAGRGYASYAVLIIWLACEAILILKAKGPAFGQKVRAILRHPSFVLMVLGVIWGAGLLSYNILVEAHTRNVSVLQTSIIDSAGRRLSFNQAFNQEYQDQLNWLEFTRTEINRVIQWSFPVDRVNLGSLGNLGLLTGMLALVGVVFWRQSTEKRIIFLLLAFSGLVWLFPMRNLAAFHDYTSMYFIGIPLIFFASLLVLFKLPKGVAYGLAVVALVVFLAAIFNLKTWHETLAGDTSKYTFDFVQIVDKIDGTGNDVYLAKAIPNGPYAARFYLSNQYLAPEDLANYVITTDRNYGPDNLTPNNRVYFLFKK